MSTIKVNTIQDTSGNTQYTAKAWVNFNGTGTVSIRASGNVSSITDYGTGNYGVNFTNALTDANHAGVSSAKNSDTTSGWNRSADWYGVSTTQGRMRVWESSTGSPKDEPYIYVAVFR
jgi:hypothetical protein